LATEKVKVGNKSDEKATVKERFSLLLHLVG
jgi:hypothetical protein